MVNSKIFSNLVAKYEELNLKAYVDNDEDKLVYLGTNGTQTLKEQMETVVDNMRNPFEDMYYWLKGEIYDI